MTNPKRLRLALAIFLPLFLLVTLFAGIVYYLHQTQIDTIDEYFSDQAFTIEDSFLENELLDNILTDEDWENLSQAQIDKKLETAGHESIGDPLDPFYKLTPKEIDQQYESFLDQKEEDPRNSEILFLDPEVTNNKDSALPSYISIDQIQALEAGISSQSLWSIIMLLGLAALGLGGLAWTLALKSLKPLELSLQKQKEFVSHVSHELRTPLAMIKTEAEVLLRANEVSGNAKEFVEHTIQDINHLDDLTNKLLQLSQMDTQTPQTESVIDISDDWQRLAERFKMRAKEERKDFSMPLIKEISLKNPLIGFKTVLRIILDNAFKYTNENDKITITFEESETTFIINVIDTGTGIDKNDILHIFERFYRADKARTTTGFGLGLSLAKESLEAMGGQIRVTSTPGKGSQFKLLFPRV